MGSRRVRLGLIALVVVSVCGCAPRYTSRPLEPVRPHADSPGAAHLLDEAQSAYERGVDFFVADEFDSAGCHLEYAISLLSRDVDWSAHDRMLSERRILLYKCRYFLERLPVIVREVAPEDQELADVECVKPPLPPIELVDNAAVRKWIGYFTGSGRETLTKWVNRSGRYRTLTARILKEEGLPAELVNLALIESGFNPNAYSSAHAVGMWQFIQSTGRIYGLRIDWWVDERRDPVRSCRAAARHLRDLYEALDSWPLALAAYNYGQRRVEREIKRARTRDYWRLRLARETRDYVPKFMAACLISSDPGRYGFAFNMEEPIAYQEIDLEPKTDLKAVARACAVTVSTLSDLNPHLVRGCVPDGTSTYTVRIPAGALEACRTELARMPKDDLIAKSFASPTLRHTVRRGETLSRIARRYGTSISAIARANGIRDYHRIKAGQSLTIPGGEYTNYPENPGIHVVRKGETLSRIGHTYRVKISDLMAWNDLKSPHVIYPGQKLVIAMDHAPIGDLVQHDVNPGETVSEIAEVYGAKTEEVLQANKLGSNDRIYPGQSLKVPVSSSRAPETQMVHHEVRSGETVSEIAEKHGTETETVLRANNLGARDRIFPGQTLKVPVSGRGAGETRVADHEVKPGETVSAIAKQYGVSVADVLRLNGLQSDDKIFPGQSLKVSASREYLPQAGVIVHEVKPGETITAIAKRYASSIDDVLETNGLMASDTIYPGQKLTVAAGAAGYAENYHTVQVGDTITSIARRYGVPVRSVLDVNGLRSRDTIYPGQKIRLPAQ